MLCMPGYPFSLGRAQKEDIKEIQQDTRAFFSLCILEILKERETVFHCRLAKKMTGLICTGKRRPVAPSRPERLAKEMTAHFYFYFIGSLIHGAWKGHKAQQTSVRLETCIEHLKPPPEPTRANWGACGPVWSLDRGWCNLLSDKSSSQACLLSAMVSIGQSPNADDFCHWKTSSWRLMRC